MARLTEAQKADKKAGIIGASAFGTLAGVNPHETIGELYLTAIGELDPDARISAATARAFERGHRLEDVALDWYADEHGVSIERIRRDVRHPRLPFVIVHPDARVKPWRQTRRLVEAKSSRAKWDAVPQHVEAQAQAQMAATGADVVDVAVLTFDGLDTFEVPRNDELIAALEDLAIAFHDRVVRRDPPPLDGSSAVSRWLDRMWLDSPEVQADADQARVLARVLAIRGQVKGLEAEEAELVNVLKFSLAGAPRLYAPGVGKVLWTAPTDRRSVSWKDVVEELTPLLPDGVDVEAIVAGHTKTEPVRQFRITPAKGTEEAAA